MNRKAIALAGFWLCLWFLPITAMAGTGTEISMPPKRVKIAHNLRLVLDTSWSDGVGYRRLKVRLIPTPAPSPADREIEVTVKPNKWSSSSDGLKIQQRIEIKQGDNSVEAEILAPQYCSWRRLALEVRENGRVLKELSFNTDHPTGDVGWSEATPALLFIDSRMPSPSQRTRQIDQLTRMVSVRDKAFNDHRKAKASGKRLKDFPEPEADKRTLPDYASALSGLDFLYTHSPPYNRWSPDLTTLQLVTGSTRLDVLPPGELPDKWIAYSSFSLVYIRIEDALRMAARYPAKWSALRNWTAAGNSLVVYGVGDNYERLAEVEQLFNLPRLQPLKFDGQTRIKERGWTPPDEAHYREVMLRTSGAEWSSSIAMADEYGFEDDSFEPAPTKQQPYKPVRDPSFVYRPCQLGQVFAVRALDFGEEENVVRSGIFNSIPGNHWAWLRRSGISMSRRNESYWNWLIPGVGGAPVLTFCVLITLFVIVIGPVNFWFVRRVKRPYLVLVTVPLGAAMVTFGLFAFAMLTDGISTRIRVRSFTHIDQRNQSAVVRSWQTYYAALAPSQGLVFDDETQVFPLDLAPKNGENHYGAARPRLLVWRDGKQVLQNGYIASRSQEQFVTTQVQSTERKLTVQKVRDPSKPPQVKNNLGTQIERMLLRDSRGAYWTCGETPDGEPVKLAKATLKDVRPLMARYWHQTRPRMPEDFDGNLIDRAYFGGWGGTSIDLSYGDPRPATGILETQLQKIRLTGKQPLKPGSYLAVVKQSPELEYGAGWLYEEASLHVIAGNW